MQIAGILSDVHAVGKKLFLIAGNKPQSMDWKDYGLKINIEKDSLLSSETAEVAVAALVGGKFKFPENTVLVSAVYSISISKPLLEPLTLIMQHCVRIDEQPGLSQHLNFAIASVNTTSLPYHFSIVKEGEFSSTVGSIKRKKFCLLCIVGEVMHPPTDGDISEGEDNEEQQEEEEKKGEELVEDDDDGFVVQGQ